MIVKSTHIDGVKIVKPEVYRDDRGLFTETYSYKKYFSKGITDNFVQDNYSHSKKNTIRGLHYQLNNPQGKLVRVLKGSVLDTALDIRVGSPSFGESLTIELNDVEFTQLYLPPGIAHGFFVTSTYVDFEYKCSDYYFPDDQFGVSYKDPSLNLKYDSDNAFMSSLDEGYLPLDQIPEIELPIYNSQK